MRPPLLRTMLASTARRRLYLLPPTPPVEEPPMRLPMRAPEYAGDFAAPRGRRNRSRKLVDRRIARRTHPRNA